MTQKKGRGSDEVAIHWVQTALARNKSKRKYSSTAPIATWPPPQNVKAQVLTFIKGTYLPTLEGLDNDAYIDSINANLFSPGFSLFLSSPAKKHGLCGSRDGHPDSSVCGGNRFLKGLPSGCFITFRSALSLG